MTLTPEMIAEGWLPHDGGPKKYDWRKYENRPSSRDAFERGGWQDRFWSRVAKGCQFECWPWTGGLTAAGYGAFKLGRGTHAASRVALASHLGRWPERDEYACHTCDNPICCNPAHLFLGSNSDNIRDAAKKGRVRRKLNEVKAGKIWNMRGLKTAKQVAADFGVTASAVQAIWERRTWHHIHKPENPNG